MVGPVVVLAPTTPTPPPAEEGSHSHGSRACLSADGRSQTTKKLPSMPASGSADPRFRGPRLFRGNIDEPRTPKPGVRAT